ncbi:MAG: hypothetical protein EHM28_05245 [Spirochaetaceae bacterium]|nr:MAG: hypothetical protein EHM28_05245 [Spirochaetaceae bacterium]
MNRNILLLSIFVFLDAMIVHAEPEYFSSDSVGLEIERINKYRLDEFEFVLEVESSGNRVTKRLLQDGDERMRWELVHDNEGLKKEELEYDKKILSIRTEYDRKGNRTLEEIYTDGQLTEKKTFNYSRRGIDFAEAFDNAGKKLYTDEYDIAPSGRLRSVRRIFPSGRIDVKHYVFAENKMVGEWEYIEGKIILSEYNSRGKLIRKETWDKDTLENITESIFNEETGAIISERERDLVNKTSTERTYDNTGNVISEKLTGSSGIPAEVSYTWENNRRIGMRKKSEIGVEEWKYFYGPDGKLEREEYYRRGFLEMRTVYKGEDSWYEEILRNEEVFVKVYYEKNKKVREEFIQDNEVIRTRDYK